MDQFKRLGVLKPKPGSTSLTRRRVIVRCVLVAALVPLILFMAGWAGYESDWTACGGRAPMEALDRKLHGQGLGTELLLDALSRAAAASNRVGGRYLAVDAIDEQAAAFYEHCGFHPCPGTGIRRLVRKISDIAATLA